MTMRYRLVFACTLAASGLALPAEALASGRSVALASPDEKQEAQGAYLTALAQYEAGELEPALTGFRASYDLVASPNAHLMIVHVLVDLGRGADAYTEAELVADEADASGPEYAAAGEAARATMAKLRQAIGLVSVHIDPGASPTALRVGDRDVARERWGKPIAVTPGSVELSLEAPSGMTTKRLDVTPGSALQVRFEAPAAAAPEPAASSDSMPTLRVAGFAAAGAGALGLLTFAVLGSMSQSTYSDIEAACPSGQCPPDRADDISSGRTQQTAANTAAVIGLVGVAAGATLITLSYRSKPAGSVQAGSVKAPSNVEASLGLGMATVRGSF